MQNHRPKLKNDQAPNPNDEIFCFLFVIGTWDLGFFSFPIVILNFGF